MADGGNQGRKPDLRTAVEDVKALATVLALEAEAILGRRTARFLGALVLVAVVVGTLLFLLESYIDPTQAVERKDLILTLAQILGGTALLSGLYFTWRTLQVNQEGQITERFTRAVDQLGATADGGNPRLEIRLGGIYALERIARDSVRDYGPVMEVLTAYVRENAPLPPNSPKSPERDSLEPSGLPSVSGSASDETSEEDDGTEQGAEKAPRTPSTDIQTILDVLKRREEDRVPEKYRVRLDLGRTDLFRATLFEANLKRASLDGANLERASLVRANLQEASLLNANLEGAYLFKARLAGAFSIGANLSGALLTEANLERASLVSANLKGANLSGANLKGADLRGADLSNAILRLADLRGAELRGAEPSEAMYRAIELLWGADSFSSSKDLEGRAAELRGADLIGANLSGAHLTQEQLEETYGDRLTRLPLDLKRPAHWGAKTNAQTEED